MNNPAKNEVIRARSKSPQKSHAGAIITSVIFVILAVFFLLNRVVVIDWFKGIGYNPTPDVLAIKTSLGLTADGERIFNATRPLLASRDDFNNSCESHDESVSVLGCYTGDRVYVYNVDDESLAGIRESTTSHELLHAVWSRLAGLEKTQLIPLLESTYADHPELKDTIESYDKSEQLDELYVRLGTQVADLPEELETHYARFFADQDTIVNFYNSYIKPFNELNAQIETLKQEMSALETEIKNRSAALDARLASFDSRVDEFNRCADTAGCFNQWTFAASRAELVAEQNSINLENDAINALINSYNAKVDTYNSSILRSSELQNLINSNSPTTKIEE